MLSGARCSTHASRAEMLSFAWNNLDPFDISDAEFIAIIILCCVGKTLIRVNRISLRPCAHCG